MAVLHASGASVRPKCSPEGGVIDTTGSELAASTYPTKKLSMMLAARHCGLRTWSVDDGLVESWLESANGHEVLPGPSENPLVSCKACSRTLAIPPRSDRGGLRHRKRRAHVSSPFENQANFVGSC